MSIKKMRMILNILVTGFMFMPLLPCANLDFYSNEDYVGPKKKFSKRESSTTEHLYMSIKEAILLALENKKAFR